jgi:predicted Zn-dependent protease with MMP-like domain
MPTTWIDSVKKSGKLTVSNKIGSGDWSSIFEPCLREINRLLKANGLKVHFEKASDGDGNVEVTVSDGPVSFTYANTTHAVKFDSTRLHGYTGLAGIERSKTVEKAFIFLPSNPKVNTVSDVRRTGVKVMKLILLHEFIHSLGLSDNDHSTDDIFTGNPTGNSGDKPDLDDVLILGKGSIKHVPPYFLSNSTVGKIKSIW